MIDFIPSENSTPPQEATEEQIEKARPKPVERRDLKPEELALVRGDGTGITKLGVEVTHSWMRGLTRDPDAYRDIVLSPEEARMLVQTKDSMRTGSAVFSIMRCHGAPLCPRSNTCPYVALQAARRAAGNDAPTVPVGKRCPLEEDIMATTAKLLAH